MANRPGNAEKYNMNTVNRRTGHPLEGKQVLFLGSSVTLGSASIEQGVPEYFAARFGCIPVKEAVCGTTLVDTGSDSYIHRLLHCPHITAAPDLVVCQLSTNDASRGFPLGQITNTDAPEGFDTATITGALEYILSYCSETLGCPVAFYTGSRYDSSLYGQMVTRIHELQDKWNFTLLDLWSNDDFNNISPELRALYMSDPIHPTKAGYRDWWCPEIERQLEEAEFLKPAN